jgi:hypothetical protein
MVIRRLCHGSSFKTSVKEKKKHLMCAKIPYSRRSKRTGNDDSGILRVPSSLESVSMAAGVVSGVEVLGDDGESVASCSTKTIAGPERRMDARFPLAWEATIRPESPDWRQTCCAGLYLCLPLTLIPGSKLGPCEIQSPLGADGMGEVYRGCVSQVLFHSVTSHGYRTSRVH